MDEKYFDITLEKFFDDNKFFVIAGTDENRKSLRLLANCDNENDAIFILSNALADFLIKARKPKWDEHHEDITFHCFVLSTLDLIERKVMNQCYDWPIEVDK